ncbi:hypothetical protein EX30DRAFT_378139 [Ascodesmis nigricans]|uniref:Uncharacterized protein n=1 Tax=Ascodesmis nigricans TaxID=341454 RepID=A0A4V3SHG9_9PEZI|nr:hypothetical protein EX30DRAFT_378139 [Ascodesmis nigricans]
MAATRKTPPSRATAPPRRLQSLKDTPNYALIPSIALARKKTTERARITLSKRAVEEDAAPLSDTRPTTTTDASVAAFSPPTTDTQPISEASNQDGRESARMQKRPYSARDLVDNLSSEELQQLVERAVQRATNPLKTEIGTLKTKIEQLEESMKNLNHRANIETRREEPPTNTPGSQLVPAIQTPELTWAQRVKKGLPENQEKREDWKMVMSSRERRKKRRQLPQHQNPTPPTPREVIAMNAALDKAGAPPHIRILKIGVNGTGTVTAKMGPKATGNIALNYKETLLKAAEVADSAVEELRANETWHRLKLHAVSLNRYYHPETDSNTPEKGLARLKEDILNVSSASSSSPPAIGKNQLDYGAYGEKAAYKHEHSNMPIQRVYYVLCPSPPLGKPVRVPRNVDYIFITCS